MYELVQVTNNTYYIQSPAKIGLYRLSDTDVCLIDSGSDKEAGRKIRQILEQNDWTLKAIYTTHSNADHIGGNKYLQDHTGCQIFAPGIEQAFSSYTILEPSFLYGGYPMKDLRHKFLLAQESEAELLSKISLPEGFEMLPLPGHFFDMVGYRTPDNVVFLADCLSSRKTLDKYGLPFIYDVKSYIETLAKVSSMEARLFVPSHAEACESIAELAQYNIMKTQEASELIVSICNEAISFENILQKLFYHYNLTMDMVQYALVGSTVRSYLSYLKDCGRLSTEFSDNLLLWKRI